VFLTYLFVSLLHGLWDGLPLVLTLSIIIPPGIPVSVVTVILSIIGIVILAVLYRRALRRRIYEYEAQSGPV